MMGAVDADENADENACILPTGKRYVEVKTSEKDSKRNHNGFLTSLRQTLCSKVSVVVIVSFLFGLLLGSSNPKNPAIYKETNILYPIVPTEEAGAVLVTGATGRTGSLLYHELRRRGVSDVRAFVRDIEKARAVLGCVKCDESEGVYIGDVTKAKDLERAMSDGSVTTLAIAVGGSPTSSPDMQRQVEFDSVVNSLKALALAHHNNSSKNHLRVVLCSSMGTNLTPAPSWVGDVLFWKLNAETFVSTSAIPSSIIVKPCGLPEGMAGKNSTLVVGHNGTIMDGTEYHTVSREDLASVMAESVVMPHECGKSTNLRFDLCSRPGAVTMDLKGLIDSSRWEWD
jgi:uncharacterized protein YbjT (DUF2867 family)